MSKIEEVARALHKQNYAGSEDQHFPSYEEFPKPWDDLARAAIEAMRKPNLVMVISAENYIGRHAYAAMIDAALSEEG